MLRYGKALFWGALALALAVGATGFYQRLAFGLRSTNLNQIVPWGLWVAFYIYFIGLSAGSFLLSTLIYVGGMKQYEKVGRLALWTALCALGAGLLFILLDIGKMDRFWTVFFHRNPRSVLEWEIHLYVLYLAVLVAELWILVRGGDMRWVKALGILGIPIAIGVHGGTGAIFAVVKARPYWYTGLFPIVFLVSALASGGGLLLFVSAFFTSFKADLKLLRGLAGLTIGTLALDLLMLGSEVLVGLYGGVPDHLAAFRLIMTGPFAWVFWGVQLALGVAVPLLIVAAPGLRRSGAWLGIAGLAVVVGIFGVRLNIVIPPLAFPVLPGLNNALASPRLNPLYVPSGMEWRSSLFVLALMTAAFAAGKLLLPLEGAPHATAQTEAYKTGLVAHD